METAARMEHVTIDQWVKELSAIPTKEFTIPRVLQFAQTRGIQPETLAPYLFYAKSHYTRNLIYKCELFEVMAICWEIGHVSRIHNHRDQNCWMATPIGRLRVQNFRVENRDASHGTCKLSASARRASTSIRIPIRAAKFIRSTEALIPMCRCTTRANTASFPPTKS